MRVVRLEVKAKRRVSHPGPAGSQVVRRVDSRLQPVDSDFRNLGPQLTSVSVFRRPWQARAKLPGRVMPRKLALAREFQLDLPAPAFLTPNREA